MYKLNELNNDDEQFIQKQPITPTAHRTDKFMANAPRIDNQNFIEQYRTLRQHQNDFLLKLNLSAKLKAQIFGFTDLKGHKKPAQNQKLVTVIDPFKGRLIMKEKVWLEIQREKQTERNISQNQFLKKKRKQQQEAKLQTQIRKKQRKQTEAHLNEHEELQQQACKKSQSGNFLGSLLKKISKNQEIQDKDQQYKQQKIQVKKTSPRKKKNSIQKKQVIRKNNSPQKKKQQNNQLKNNNMNRNMNEVQTKQIQKKIIRKSQKFESPLQIFEKVIDKPKKSERKKTQLSKQFSQNISEIPKQDVQYQQFSSPSFHGDKFSQNQSVQQIIRQKKGKN